MLSPIAPDDAPSTHSPTMPQDMPPSGGYNPVMYRRNLPQRGFRPAFYLLAMGGIMTYGMIKVGQGIRESKYVYPYSWQERGKAEGGRRGEQWLIGQQ